MSRCFPFPPPGYEKAARSGDNNEDLLKKEKHKEKKHKKEKKRDREKREGKEGKDKDGTKDKKREKNRKEKHKDKTKDKDRDKDKNRTSEDTKTAIPPEIRQEDKFGYNCKSEVQDSKFTKEVGRSIRDEERGAAERNLANFTTTTQRRLDTGGISTASEKESNKMVPDFAGRLQKRNENLTLPQKRTEGMGTGFATSKQKNASGENVFYFSSSEPGKNHVASRPAGNFTGPFQSRTEGTVTSNSLQKERSGSNNLANSLQKGKCASNNVTGREVNNFTGSGQRIEGMLTANSMQKERAGCNNVPGWPVDNFIGFTKKNGFTTNLVQKEKGASNNLVINSPGAAQRKNGGMGQQSQNLSSSIQRSTGCIGLAPKMEKERVRDGEISMYKERGASNNVVPNLVGVAQRKIDRMGQQVGNLMPSIPRSAEGIGLAPKMEKEAIKDSGMVPNSIGTEQRTNDWMDKSAEKPSEKKKEKKEKSKEKKIKEGKGEKHKDGDRNEKKKSKRKDKDQHKEKEKEEKIREKSEHKRKEHDMLEEIRTKDQVVDITKLIAPPAENANTTLSDQKNKKRKEIELNGFLHETDERPNKLPKTTASSSYPIMENGKTLKLNYIPSCLLPQSLTLLIRQRQR
ncbi:TRAF3-interacting protein 1-like [Iris pallida]|uniref:TRAF3-interacting protein 1-like n=1 Tax=Iris pallida TaxID=29817 RepID=A0AAX6H586_IRIPA|nr:TRAF3-interacting protein 1-like [Iris pallida]